jgi:DNA repair protein RadC
MGADYQNRITNWSLEDRPREKLLRLGVRNLTNVELVALLLGSGTRKTNAVELARELLGLVDNDLNELGRLDIDDLTKIKGIGTAKAVTVKASLELGFRRSSGYTREKIFIRNSAGVFELMQGTIGPLDHEEFWIITLNRAHRVINSQKISQGGLTGTVIDTRMILRHALDKKATSLVICHNHPSGNTRPSEADISITKKIKEAAELMDISLLDHLVITSDAYFSFADEGLLV